MNIFKSLLLIIAKSNLRLEKIEQTIKDYNFDYKESYYQELDHNRKLYNTISNLMQEANNLEAEIAKLRFSEIMLKEQNHKLQSKINPVSFLQNHQS